MRSTAPDRPAPAGRLRLPPEAVGRALGLRGYLRGSWGRAGGHADSELARVIHPDELGDYADELTERAVEGEWLDGRWPTAVALARSIHDRQGER